MTKGVCRFCGCSHFDPCPEGCDWAAGSNQMVCTECSAANLAEREAWTKLMPSRRLGASPFFVAFHKAFVVGWFKVNAANPYRDYRTNNRRGVTYSRAWQRFWREGHDAGAEARRIYTRAAGPILNTPRRFVWQRAA